MRTPRLALFALLLPLGATRQAAVEDRAATFAGSAPGTTRTVAGITLCWCPPGRFLMGSPESEPDRRADEAQVEVTLTRGFWLGKFEVTQAQWLAAMGSMGGPLTVGAGDHFPAYWITFPEAEEFCRRLTVRARAAGELPPGWAFRVPTEAQWEYACRAGTTTAFSGGDTLTRAQANLGQTFREGSAGTPGYGATPVGTYPANAWGLHDMHGNEFEWCRDWYHARLPGGTDPDLSATPGQPNRDGSFSRVRRGGAWMDAAGFCRSALRLRYEPPRQSDHIGLRVALVQE